MYVCLCNGISDKTLRHAIRKYHPHTLQQLRRIVPVGQECGKCIRQTREILEEEIAQLPQFVKVA